MAKSHRRLLSLALALIEGCQAVIARGGLIPELHEPLHEPAAALRVVAGPVAAAYEAINRVIASKDKFLVVAHGSCYFGFAGYGGGVCGNFVCVGVVCFSLAHSPRRSSAGGVGKKRFAAVDSSPTAMWLVDLDISEI